MQHFTVTALLVVVGLCGTLAAQTTTTIATPATEQDESLPEGDTASPPPSLATSTRSGRMLVPPHSHIAGHSSRYNMKPPPPLVTRIRPRSDHLAGNGPESLAPPHHRRFSQPPPPRGGPQLVRRVHNGISSGAVGQPPRLHYGVGGGSFEGPPKNGGRYVGEKAVPGGKPPRGNHPNALGGAAGGGLPQYVGHPQQQHQQQFKASPHYNGKAIVRPISEFEQQQQQPHLQHQQPHLTQQQHQQPHLAQQQQSVSYQSVKQYPLPQFPPTHQQKHQQQQAQPHLQQQPHQQQRFQTPYQSHTQKPNFYSGPPKGGESFYTNVHPQQEGQEQKPQPPQQYQHPKEPHHQHAHQQFNQQQQQHPSYSVYEDAHDGNNNGGASQAPQASYGDGHKMADTNAEAQDYLKFMSTNEYFLPKREPDYKLRDSLNDQRQQQKQYDQQQQQQQKQYDQQQQQQQQQQYDQEKAQSQQKYSYKRTQQQQQQQEQQQKTTKTYNKPGQYSKPAGSRAISSSSGASPYQEPLQVSQLFYDGQSDSSAAVVRGSYQAGSNTFVVNSDGNKAVKHIVPSPLPSIQETTPSSGAAYSSFGSSQLYQNGGSSGDASRRTPEPLRFEFTEHDAVSPVAYTNTPLHQLRYQTASSGGATSTQPPTTQRLAFGRVGGGPSSSYSGHNQHQHHVKPVSEPDDDPEDGEDMQEASSDIYGRVPLSPAATGEVIVPSPHPTPAVLQQALGTEQNDTEEYCERICSSVQDDDEEVVCGSDGYMYTSEQQMDCYAECLRIDVTIQSKGSCSA